MAYSRQRTNRTISSESLTIREGPFTQVDLRGEDTAVMSRSCSVFVKWTVTFLLTLAFLACIVFNKLTIVFIGAFIYDLNANRTHDVAANATDITDRTYGVESSMAFLIMLVILPYFTTIVRGLWCGALRKDRPLPSLAAFFWCIGSSLAESLGIALFCLDLILHSFSGVVTEIPLMNAVFILPICVQIVETCRASEVRKASIAKDIIALVLAVGGSIAIVTCNSLRRSATNALTKNEEHQEWAGILGLLLLSFSWLPASQRAQLEPARYFKRQKMYVQRKYSDVPATSAPTESAATRTAATESAAGSAATDSSAGSNDVHANENGADRGNANNLNGRDGVEESRRKEDDTIHDEESKNKCTDREGLLFAISNPEQSARWKVSLISNTIKLLLTPLFVLMVSHFSGVMSMSEFWSELSNANVHHPIFCPFIVNACSSFLGYLLGWVACMLCIQGPAFRVPLILGGPLASVIAWQVVNNPQALHFPVIFNGVQDNLVVQISGPMCLYAAQMIFSGMFIFCCSGPIMQKDSKIFWLPGFNSLFLDQFLQLGRRILLFDDEKDVVQAAQRTRVYMCTTMYREATHEMEQLTQSINKINNAKQSSDRHFQSHIFFDNGVRDKWIKPLALQLVSVLERELGVKSEDCTKVMTPYGMNLSWQLPSVLPGKTGMILTVHLKDILKVKSKKRWSQVMYMSYVLDYLMKEDDEATDETTYILATDADVKFEPESVEALLDLMSRDAEVGAVCARTHPMGRGPLYWYQIFDYAIGHWLQRSTNHILGTVLCCPGCFSVYRAGALRQVLPIYATNVKDSSEFLIKDMGEDRWLCTLMVQHGWRLEYCAAAENSTFCPDTFDEFFKQRRRWIASTMANLTVLLQRFRSICRDNKHISFVFILYQSLLLLSALVSPSVCVLVISGGLFYAWDVTQSVSVTLLLLTCVIYTFICLNASQKIQLRVAKFLTIIFALIMAAVAIGTVIQVANETSARHTGGTTTAPPILPNTTKAVSTTRKQLSTTSQPTPEINVISLRRLLQIHNNHEESAESFSMRLSAINSIKVESYELPVSVTTIYLSGLAVIYLLTALLHLPETYCIFHGIWYLLCLPAGYLILLIYALCNITDSSWGTREEVGNEDVLVNYSFFSSILRIWTFKGQNGHKVDKMVQTGDESKRSSLVEGSRAPEGENDQFERSSSYAFCSEKSTSSFDGPTPVALWLPKSLLMYSSKLEASGFEDTSFLAGVTDWELRNVVGISSTFHRRAILDAVRKLPDAVINPGIPDRVDDWLEDIGLGAYGRSFRRKHLLKGSQLEIIKTMDQDEIKRELHITKPGHIKRLIKALRFLRYPTEGEKQRQKVAALLDSLDTHKLVDVNRREHDFWTSLRHLSLMPEDSMFLEQQCTLSEGLTGLRNNTLIVFTLVNTIWIILILTLITKTELNVLHTNALGLAFLVTFGLVVLIQFVCMVAHRIGTWLHLVARAPYCCGSPLQTSWAFKDETLSKKKHQSGTDATDPSDAEAARERDALTEELRNRRIHRKKTYKKLEEEAPRNAYI